MSGKNLSLRLKAIGKVSKSSKIFVATQLLFFAKNFSGSQTLSVVEFPDSMGENLLHGVEIVSAKVPVYGAGFNDRMINNFSIFRLVPLGMNSL